jgi:hypothetical protein
MRDLVVREALTVMARDAAKRLRELIAQGEDLPYDVHEAEAGSPLPQYVPLTERFIRGHAGALCALDSFGAACAAIESVELAAPYLESFGIAVPDEPRKRGELAGVVFLCRMWAGSTDFPIDEGRVGGAITELEAGGELAEDEIEVIVPLRGFQMPTARLELATATIVRSDTVDVPGEARATEGTGAAGWEPTFLAATRVSESDGPDGPSVDAGARAVEAFRQLITTLRLFGPGGVALGPYAWTRAGEHRWRRIATGDGRPRAGGYRLSEEDLADLAMFSRTLAYRSTAFGRPAQDRSGLAGALSRAIARFEAGLERATVIDALNDYLLAMRFVLEGGGPAHLGLAMRVAALCAEPEARGRTKAIVDRAVSLERELWSGEPAPTPDGGLTPAQTAADIEDLTRAILRDAACGHLGADLRSTADEILLADGLAAGEGRAEQRGDSLEWNVPEADVASADTREMSVPELEAALDEPDAASRSVSDETGWSGREAAASDSASRSVGDEPADDDGHTEIGEKQAVEAVREEPSAEPQGDEVEQGSLWMDIPAEWEGPGVENAPEPVQVPEPRARITVESGAHEEEDTVIEDHSLARRPTTIGEAADAAGARIAELLDEQPTERDETADRVAYLFPRPETTEWDVRELSYDRRRRARIRAS